MPKITTHRYKNYDVSVLYNLKNRSFYINLPEDLLSYTCGGQIFAKTQYEVENQFDKIANKFIEEGSEKEKYIAIEADKKEDGFWANDEFYRAGGVAGFLKMQWAIVYRVKINGEHTYKYTEKIHDNKIALKEFYSKDSVLIKWSKQRELFLKKATDIIQQLASNIHKLDLK